MVIIATSRLSIKNHHIKEFVYEGSFLGGMLMHKTQKDKNI